MISFAVNISKYCFHYILLILNLNNLKRCFEALQYDLYVHCRILYLKYLPIVAKYNKVNENAYKEMLYNLKK